MSLPTHAASLPPRFEVIRHLGSGGMGVVLEVWDRERGERLALKTLREPSPEAIYRLKREFRLLTELPHPGLIRLHELFVDGGTCFFTMDLVEGHDLLRHATRRPREAASSTGTEGASAAVDDVEPPHADPTVLRRLLLQLADVLDFLHDEGHVHRDLKPQNILVTAEERVVVLDFGLVEDSSRTNLDGIVGTAGYMAPEQWLEQPVDAAADWYSVGCILYEALTGRLPYGGDTAQREANRQSGAPPPPHTLVAGADRTLGELAVDLLAADPAARPSSAEVRRRLGVEPAAAAAPSSADTPSRHSFGAGIVGRDGELERLQVSLTRLVAGWRRAVVIFGQSGIGKSSLVRAFLHAGRQRHPGLVCLQGRCIERESVSYQALDGLIDDLSSFWRTLPDTDAAAILPEEPSLLSRLFPVLGRVRAIADSPPIRSVADPSDLRSRGFAALRDVLQRIAERRPLVIVLDDMQWADANTLDLLADVMRRPAAPNVMLVLSSRPSGRQKLEEWLPQLDLELERIELSPLPMAVCEEFARARLGPDAALATAVASESGGVPIFLQELVQHVSARQDVAVAGVSLDGLMRARIAALPPGAARVLEVVSVTGEPTSRAVLAATAGCSVGELPRDLGPLAVNRLVRLAGRRATDNVEAYHDRVRELVLGGLSPAQRRELHRRVALALVEAQEDQPHLLARHWLGAGEHQRAADHARVAAALAAKRLDFLSAAELYELAIDHGEWDPKTLRELLFELGTLRSRAGLPAGATEAFTRAAEAEGPDGLHTLDMRRRAAEELLRGGYLDEGLDAVRGVLATLGTRLAKTPLRALVSLLWRRAWLRLRGLRQRKSRPGENSPALLTRIDVYNTVAMGLAIVDAVRGAEFQSRSLLASLRSGDAERTARALAVESGYLSAQGAGRRARLIGERARQLANEVGGSLPLAHLFWGVDGFYAYCVTNAWQEAFNALGESERLFRSGVMDAGWEIDTVRLYSCFSLLYLGELKTLASCVPTYIREAERRGDRYWAVSLRTRLSIAWLVKDDVASGIRDVDDAIASWAPWEDGFQVQHFFALHGRCELALYRGDPEAAAQHLARGLPGLRRSLLLRISMVELEVLHLEGRIAAALAARSQGHERERHLRVLRRVARKLRRHDRPVGRALAPLLTAAAAHLSGDRPSAITSLREGVQMLDALDTRLHAAAARFRLGTLTGEDDAGRPRAEAIAYFDAHGVAAPEKLVNMLVPGW